MQHKFFTILIYLV